MLLVATKMIELLARAAFTVGMIFMLPIAAAGQFGLLVTLIGLFAFAFGWERHIDVQRRLVGADSRVFDEAVSRMVRLWLVNYLWMLPLFALVLLLYAGISLYLAVLVLVVAICEQVGNVAYNISVVERRYHLLVVCVAAKNIFLLFLSVALFFFFTDRLSLPLILEFWAGVSLVATLGITTIWWARHKRSQDLSSDVELKGVWAQHRASLTHFFTGLLAVLILQIDRLTVGALVPLDQAGVYFRHVMLIAFVYQFFSVASYNRCMPEILLLARDESVGAAQRRARRELFFVAGLIVAGFAGAVGLDWLTGHDFTMRWHIAISLLAIMLVAALARIAADFQALILNVRMKEKRVLLNQALSFGVGLVLLTTLTLTFGIYGTAAATLGSAIFYLALNLVAVRMLDRPPIGVTSQ